jgi:hypothetical protein
MTRDSKVPANPQEWIAELDSVVGEFYATVAAERRQDHKNHRAIRDVASRWAAIERQLTSLGRRISHPPPTRPLPFATAGSVKGWLAAHESGLDAEERWVASVVTTLDAAGEPPPLIVHGTTYPLPQAEYRRIEQLHSNVHPYLLRRDGERAARSLPGLTRAVQDVRERRRRIATLLTENPIPRMRSIEALCKLKLDKGTGLQRWQQQFAGLEHDLRRGLSDWEPDRIEAVLEKLDRAEQEAGIVKSDMERDRSTCDRRIQVLGRNALGCQGEIDERTAQSAAWPMIKFGFLRTTGSVILTSLVLLGVSAVSGAGLTALGLPPLYGLVPMLTAAAFLGVVTGGALGALWTLWRRHQLDTLLREARMARRECETEMNELGQRRDLLSKGIQAITD